MGGLNKFFNLDKANAESKKTLENLGDSATAGQKISTVTTNIFKNLDKSALAAGGLFKLAGFLFDQFKKADQSTTDIARGLSMSKKEEASASGVLLFTGMFFYLLVTKSKILPETYPILEIQLNKFLILNAHRMA